MTLNKLKSIIICSVCKSNNEKKSSSCFKSLHNGAKQLETLATIFISTPLLNGLFPPHSKTNTQHPGEKYKEVIFTAH